MFKRAINQGSKSIIDSSFRSLSTTPKHFDAIIIGSGVIGSAIALELNKLGIKTLTLDKLGQAGMGSSSYSSAICRSFYSIPESVRLANEGFLTYKNLRDHCGGDDECGYAELQEVGGLVIESKASESFLANCLPTFADEGLTAEHWTMEQVNDYLPPGFDWTPYYPPKRIDHPEFGEVSKTNKITGAYWFPQTGYVNDPALAAHNLQQAALRAGGIFRYNTEVKDIVKKGGRIQGVTTAANEFIEAPVVVNVAGPHSNMITEMAFRGGFENDMLLSTAPRCVEVCYFNTPNKEQWKKLPVIMDLDTGIYMRSQLGDRIVVGGTEPECDPERSLVNADQHDSAFTDDYDNYMYRFALRYPELPLSSGTSTQGITAMYDVSDDWTPIYDKSSLPGYYMAIGTSGNQFKTAPATGLMMAKLIQHCENGLDHDSTPYQHTFPKSGKSVSMSVWSRRRKVNNTSMSVLS